MIKKILIANRGEIACRIIKTAKRLGILTGAVYSEVDANALHVQMADEAIGIGPAPSNESYLVVENIIQAAKQTQADAIHPGYGFLSENVAFRQSCDAQGLIFIGPSAQAIEAMGSKSAAKAIMSDAGVPLVPGYHGEDQSMDVLKASADSMGYPVLLKASAGGGGKGMRQVWKADEFEEALNAAKRESLKSFSGDKMLVEKYLTKPRHVEVQVFCDEHGNAIYLADRDCSIQRRHQKVIEEAPAPNIQESIRQQMGNAAVRAAQAIDYTGAGTVEFLLDEDNTFYFMEMNTRLQVEHPVTEKVTGVDLVEWQVNVANGEKLPLTQDQVTMTGHAFEARIYAEDPRNDFLPASGVLDVFSMPIEDDNVRIDTGVVEKDHVSIFYDPMIAKLIVWGEDRNKALALLAEALEHCKIEGLSTNVSFLYNLACHPALKNIELDTHFIEKHQDVIFKNTDADIQKALVIAAVHFMLKAMPQASIKGTINASTKTLPWNDTMSWRMNQAQNQLVPFFIRNDMHEVFISQEPNGHYHIDLSRSFPDQPELFTVLQAEYVDSCLRIQLTRAGKQHNELSALVVESESEYQFFTETGVYVVDKYTMHQNEQHSDSSSVIAALHGTIVTLLVALNQPVKKGDPLLVMEAMKMEHTITAPEDGVVAEFYCQAGDLVESGVQLLDFQASN